MTSVRMLVSAVALIAALAAGSAASAGTLTIFEGHDDGAATGGPFPNSLAAWNSFLAAAATFGPVDSTIGFELAVPGFHDVNFSGGIGTLNYVATSFNFGSGISGANITTLGNLNGFNVNPSGDTWVGFPTGLATVNLTAPSHSFGFWITGLQTAQITVSFNDGAAQVLHPTSNSNGGAQFFGFTDTTTFTSLTIFDNQGGATQVGDAWGIDRLAINVAGVPGPVAGSGLPGLVLAFSGLVAWLRRRRQIA